MIRKIMESDREAYFRLANEFYNSPAMEHPLPTEIISQNFENAVSDSPYLDGYVFTEGDEVVGFSFVTKSYATEVAGVCIWIEDVYVGKAHQGKGLGKEFFDYVFSRYNDAKRFRLEVMPDNKNAIRLYDRLGFESNTYTQLKLDI